MKHPRKIVKGMDPKLDEKDEAFAIAMALIGAAQVGTSADKIAKRTGLPRNKVRSYATRARQQGIFAKDGKIDCEWFDKEAGGIAFWCDVAVVQGLMNRSTAA